MGATVLPSSVFSRRSAAVSHTCTSRSRIGINPACFAKPAAAKKPKRPGSFHDGDPPAKRARGACAQGEPDAAAAAKIKKQQCTGRSSSSPPVAGARAVFVSKNLSSTSPNQVLGSAAPSKPLTMSELIAKARLAKDRSDVQEDMRLRDIQRRREEARQELEKMVATVEFNNPFIDPSDVFK